MALPLVWMAQVLHEVGITVVQYSGWRKRGRMDDSFRPRAVMWHHDASAPGDSPGVPDYMANPNNSGAQCWVDRQGRWTLIAAGRMWHAGVGTGWGLIPSNEGNTYSIGIETDHTVGESWPDEQLNSLRLGTAALLIYMKADPAKALCGHREYAPGRKIDPAGLTMSNERKKVAELMSINSSVVNKNMREGVRWIGHGDPKVRHNPKNSIKQVRAELAALTRKVDSLTDLVSKITEGPNVE